MRFRNIQILHDITVNNSSTNYPKGVCFNIFSYKELSNHAY